MESLVPAFYAVYVRNDAAPQSMHFNVQVIYGETALNCNPFTFRAIIIIGAMHFRC